MVFRRGKTVGCAIAVVNSVDGILPKFLDFMLLGSVILELLSFQLTMNIGICQVRLLVLQPSLEPMRDS